MLMTFQHWLLNEQEFRRNPALGEGEGGFLSQTDIKASYTDVLQPCRPTLMTRLYTSSMHTLSWILCVQLPTHQQLLWMPELQTSQRYPQD